MNELGFEYVSAKVISEHLGIPAPTVVRILKRLGDGGVVTTKEGFKGGVMLARQTACISLLDIFLAIERGPLFKTENDYAARHPKIGQVRARIATHMQDAEAAMKRSLEQTALSDIYDTIIRSTYVENE
jgi:Rrf2 family protein